MQLGEALLKFFHVDVWASMGRAGAHHDCILARIHGEDPKTCARQMVPCESAIKLRIRGGAGWLGEVDEGDGLRVTSDGTKRERETLR